MCKREPLAKMCRSACIGLPHALRAECQAGHAKSGNPIKCSANITFVIEGLIWNIFRSISIQFLLRMHRERAAFQDFDSTVVYIANQLTSLQWARFRASLHSSRPPPHHHPLPSNYWSIRGELVGLGANAQIGAKQIVYNMTEKKL